MSNFSGNEFQAATRGLVVETDRRASEKAVTLAVVYSDVMTKHLGCAVRAARIELCIFILRRFFDFAKHLRARSLQKLRLRLMFSDRFQHPHNAKSCYVRCEHRLAPRRRNEALRREIINLIGL